jgi:uncharacterized protein YjbI with pentapeptide repeats
VEGEKIMTKLESVLSEHDKWLGGSSGSRADLSDANLSGANLSGANLRRADLSNANLRDANLRRADLSDANLSDANLRRADLSNAYLRDANLSGANLSNAYLSGADLRNADLSDANLSGANLSGANLRRADLSDADLSDADLNNANLRRADLSNAYLRDTCCDPSALIPAIADNVIVASGLAIYGDYVYGWRTRKSLYTATQYIPGKSYRAPVFSVCTIECHPGIYLAPWKWLMEGGHSDLVRCRTLRKNLHHAGDQWRTRELEIIES